MQQVNHPFSWRQSFETICVFLSILAAVVLLIVWALPNTIAARNISIVVGLVASIVWVLLTRPSITRSDLIVPALLMGVPLWLWIIYFFWSIDPVSQYKEMTGTWFRVTLLIIFGFNLGLIISRNNKLIIWIWLALVSLPIATLILYLYTVYDKGIWNISYYTGFFKTKVAGVYFLMWPCLLAYACIHRVAIERNYKAFTPSLIFNSLIPIFLIIVCLWMFYVLDALTGILIAGFFLFTLVIFCLSSLFKRKSSKNKITIIFSLLALITAFLFVSIRYGESGNQKLNNLISDVIVSYNIEKTTLWQGIPNAEQVLPTGSHGHQVNSSTYVRVSFIVKGFEFLSRHPLGSGDMHFSFGRYMNQDYPGSTTSKTHCGWLDFALGAGLPGLLFAWAGLYLIVYNFFQKTSQRTNSLIELTSIWMLGGIWTLFWPAELSYREFMEHLFFLIVLFGVQITSSNNS